MSRDAFVATISSLDSWIERKNRLLNPAGKIASLLKRFQGFSIMGVGLTLKPGERVESFKPLPSRDHSALIRLLKEFGDAGNRIRIVIDDPDRLFTRGSTFDPQLLAGYILGTSQ